MHMMLTDKKSRTGNRGFTGVLYKMWPLLPSWLAVSRSQPRWHWLKL